MIDGLEISRILDGKIKSSSSKRRKSRVVRRTYSTPESQRDEAQRRHEVKLRANRTFYEAVMIEKAPVFYMARKSRFGIFAIVWRDYYGQPKIKRVLISKPGLSAYDKVGKEYPGIKESECGEIKKVAECMDSFFEGGAVSFPLDVTLIERCTDFQKKVLRAEHGIPRGCVSTYKKIAEHLEKPGGARAVGTALATNPFPIIIPCHRAIRTDGTLGGYQGGLEMKKRLLEMEGVSVGENGCVLTDKYFY